MRRKKIISNIGIHFTFKILVIVRTLLKIKRREPTAKALVFSCVSNCSILYSHRTAANLYIVIYCIDL